MSTYPDFEISTKQFDLKTDDDSQIVRASDGTPWAYRGYPKNRYTFTVVHPAMTTAEELQLRDFYDTNKGDFITFNDPRTGKAYSVLMVGPPSYSGVRGGLHVDIMMKLTGEQL